MPDPCGVMAGNFGDMSSANKYAALAGALGKGESSAKNCEHELREGGLDVSEPADVVHIDTPMQSQLSGESGAPPFENDTAATKQGHPDSHMYQYSALIPLLQRQVLCVDTTASTPSTLR